MGPCRQRGLCRRCRRAGLQQCPDPGTLGTVAHTHPAPGLAVQCQLRVQPVAGAPHHDTLVCQGEAEVGQQPVSGASNCPPVMTGRNASALAWHERTGWTRPNPPYKRLPFRSPLPRSSLMVLPYRSPALLDPIFRLCAPVFWPHGAGRKSGIRKNTGSRVDTVSFLRHPHEGRLAGRRHHRVTERKKLPKPKGSDDGRAGKWHGSVDDDRQGLGGDPVRAVEHVLA